MEIDWTNLLNAAIQCVVFSAVGLVMFAVAFAVVEKITPFSIHKEIEEDQNMALGIVIGSVIIGVALIVAAAITG